MEEIMAWRPTILLRDHEAIDVLMLLKLRGVKINLDGDSQTQVIQAIESFLSKYRRSAWSMLVADITGAIRRELLKSRNEIDAKLVREVVDYLKNGGVEKKKKKKENGSDKGESDEEEEDGEGFKDKDGSDEEDADSDGPRDEYDDEDDRYKGSEEEESDSGFEDDSNEEDEAERKKLAAPNLEMDEFEDEETRQECIEDLIILSKERGMTVKEGDEEDILNMMIPYIRDCALYYNGIIVFLKRVREHIDRCCILDNVKTVEAALKNSFFVEDYEDCKIAEQTTMEEEDVADAKDQVNHSLEKNMVPTKEEITTTMNRIHQEEKREYGDKMEIEEHETLIRSNQRDSCIRESLEKGGTNKRKLAEV